ncbi:MAG: AfsR/SARP family transcriptional regulator [Streptosporangiaceae bacterium]
MTIALSLLGDVRCRRRPVTGDRPPALFAALASAGGRTVAADDLVERVWGDDAPANRPKSLQVLVSRTRSACGADAVVRDGAGYRLGAGPDEIDSLRLARLVRAAAAALDRDAALAIAAADSALALAGGLSPAAGSGTGPLYDIRAAAAADAQAAREKPRLHAPAPAERDDRERGWRGQRNLVTAAAHSRGLPRVQSAEMGHARSRSPNDSG